MALSKTLITILVGLLLLGAAQAQAQSRKPLLMEGKTALYQRVLTRPEATLRSAPREAAAAVGAPLSPFSILYVYERLTSDGPDWVEVGAGSDGHVQGWLPARDVVDWKQALILTFTNPAGRERVLFFDNRDRLIELLESETGVPDSRTLRHQAVTGTLPAGSPVISIEPATHVDIQSQFYLLPILSTEETYLASGFTTRLLEIAAVTREAGAETAAAPSADPLADYRIGVAFVVDTTLSMEKYIQRAREAMRRILLRVGGSSLADRFRFALVGYRDNTAAVPGLGYVKHTFADLAHSGDARGFFARVDDVKEASVSSKDFQEDAFAGVREAIEGLGWEGYPGRFVILITDASARDAGDPLSETRMNASQLRSLAQNKNETAIFVLHLRTEEGRFDHDRAAAQYQELSYWPNVGSLYYSVEAGSTSDFHDTVDRLGDELLRQVNERADEIRTDGETKEERERLLRKAAQVGHAMQLAYLGRRTGARVPPLFQAWIPDRAPEDPTKATVEVRVLLSKTQLSDLQRTLGEILEAGNRTRLSPQDFFDQLRSAAAMMGRDPGRIGGKGARTLAELGLLGEYLEDLPYRSRLMELSQESWLTKGRIWQQELLDDLEAKVRLYEEFHDNPDLWVALDGGRVPGDALYPVLLDDLP